MFACVQMGPNPALWAASMVPKTPALFFIWLPTVFGIVIVAPLAAGCLVLACRRVCVECCTSKRIVDPVTVLVAVAAFVSQ